MGKKNKKPRAKDRKQAAAEAPSSAPPAEASVAPSVAASVAPAPPVEVVEEHRASKRISIEVELHLTSESHFFSGLSGDISEGGVFVSTYRALAMGSLVDLEFSLPGSDHPVHARGEVRWHRDGSPDAPPGVGIAFEDLGDDDREAIHRFCTMRPPLYYEDVG